MPTCNAMPLETTAKACLNTPAPRAPTRMKVRGSASRLASCRSRFVLAPLPALPTGAARPHWRRRPVRAADRRLAPEKALLLPLVLAAAPEAARPLLMGSGSAAGAGATAAAAAAAAAATTRVPRVELVVPFALMRFWRALAAAARRLSASLRASSASRSASSACGHGRAWAGMGQRERGPRQAWPGARG